MWPARETLSWHPRRDSAWDVGTANGCEPMIKIVKFRKAKSGLRRLAKMVRGMEVRFDYSTSQSDISPVDSWSLTRQITSKVERGSSVARPHEEGTESARISAGAELGCWTKQKPDCNGSDTGFHPTRKRAHLQLVFHCMKVCGINFAEESK